MCAASNCTEVWSVAGLGNIEKAEVDISSTENGLQQSIPIGNSVDGNFLTSLSKKQ